MFLVLTTFCSSQHTPVEKKKQMLTKRKENKKDFIDCIPLTFCLLTGHCSRISQLLM
uniref:Uncharacterized protein n=1 Tax=Nelumbo nucifera TaxID=4432 RepID=A0A822Z5V9_NELNU|nr:TPA_asm: hypothetical protein HUJ06_014276 [Nelumbo nucifera]